MTISTPIVKIMKNLKNLIKFEISKSFDDGFSEIGSGAVAALIPGVVLAGFDSFVKSFLDIKTLDFVSDMVSHHRGT